MTIKERFKEYLSYKGISEGKFEQAADLSNGYISNIGKSIGSQIQNKIKKHAADLNMEWLLHEDGEMLNSEPTTHQITQTPIEGYVPIYDITFTLGFTPTFLDSMNTPEILGYSNFPELRGATYVVRGKGNSMAPFICDGDFVGIRPVRNRNIIDFGNPYGIITNDLAIFKRIKKAKDTQNLKLVSDNDTEHEDWEVPREEIIHLFIVVGVLSVKSVTY